MGGRPGLPRAGPPASLGAAGARGEFELREAVASLLVLPLDRNRPLWEMHLVEGLDVGRCALFQKVHHCMVDGVAGAQLLEELLDAAPVVRDLPVAPTPPATATGSAERIGSALLDGVRGSLRTAEALLGALRRPSQARAAARRLRDAAFSAVRLATQEIPELPWNAPIGRRRRLAFTRIPLAGVRRVQAVRGGTLNDVVLSFLAGGIHRYLRGLGMRTRGLEVTALVPVSLRSSDEARTLGNRISAMLVPLAADLTEEVPRLAATRALTEKLKSAAAWTGIDALLTAADGLPAALVALFGPGLRPGRLANVIATNVPGPRETRFLCGARVEALHPIVPIVDGIGLGLAVFSYDGWLYVGLHADADLVPDVDKLAQGIEQSFADLLASA